MGVDCTLFCNKFLSDCLLFLQSLRVFDALGFLLHGVKINNSVPKDLHRCHRIEHPNFTINCVFFSIEWNHLDAILFFWLGACNFSKTTRNAVYLLDHSFVGEGFEKWGDQVNAPIENNKSFDGSVRCLHLILFLLDIQDIVDHFGCLSLTEDILDTAVDRL